MARDYKYRASQGNQRNTIAWWRWGAVLLVIALFASALYLLDSSFEDNDVKKIIPTKKVEPVVKKVAKPKPKHQDKKPEQPRFDFYTILPETEVIVPEYEIKTRQREEKIGKAKPTKYLIQAGSFKDFTEADKLRARLALMGIESRVEKAKIGDTVWNRVKMGPYKRSASVLTIKKRLKSNGIDVIVTEFKK